MDESDIIVFDKAVVFDDEKLLSIPLKKDKTNYSDYTVNLIYFYYFEYPLFVGILSFLIQNLLKFVNYDFMKTLIFGLNIQFIGIFCILKIYVAGKKYLHLTGMHELQIFIDIVKNYDTFVIFN